MMNGQIVWDHFKELQNEFPNLVLTFESSRYYIRGALEFRAQFSNKELIAESYSIEIEVSDQYPYSLPVARELGGRIPKSFHTFTNGTLCLGAPIAIKMTFSKEPTLLGFVKTLLVPYLYSYSYREKNNECMPYGELEHGAKGIIGYYLELFQVTSIDAVLKFLRAMAFNKIRGHLPCPCESGSKIRNCHGPKLVEIQKFQTSNEFRIELIDCIEHVRRTRR